jgi:uncharacterized membrane protein YwaF
MHWTQQVGTAASLVGGIVLFTVLYQQAWSWATGPCVFHHSWPAQLANLVVDTSAPCLMQRSMGEQQLAWIRYYVVTWLTGWAGTVLSWWRAPSK